MVVVVIVLLVVIMLAVVRLEIVMEHVSVVQCGVALIVREVVDHNAQLIVKVHVVVIVIENVEIVLARVGTVVLVPPMQDFKYN